MFRPRLPIRNARILVTGASSGIGAALAKQLARRGAIVILTARRGEKLEHLASQIQRDGGKASYVVGDLADPETHQSLCHHAQSQWSGLDILVNNAGIGAVGTFASTDPGTVRKVMEVNFFAAVTLTQRLLPILRESHDPSIVNIGSVLGLFAMPNKSIYCASKFALRGWSQSLRDELAGENVPVTHICPNTTSTEFFEHAVQSKGTAAKNPYSMSPERVAQITINAMQRRRPEVIISAQAKFLVWMERFFPAMTHFLLQRTT